MMNNPTSPEPIKEEKRNAVGAAVRTLAKRITHHWVWKVLSLLLAVLLWGTLISMDTTLPRDKTIDHVNITVTNEAALKEKGLIVVSGLEDLPAVRLKVSVPQKNYNAASASNYVVRLDLSQVEGPGTQKLALSAASTSTSLYGTVTDLSVKELPLTIEEYATRSRIPVQVESIGQLPEGLYAVHSLPDPDTVDISGPKSIIDSVARCTLLLDLSQSSAQPDTTRTALPFVLENYAGEVLDASAVSISSYGLPMRDGIVQQQFYSLISVPIDEKTLLSGKPASGYQVTEVRIIPDHVLLAVDDHSPFLSEGVTIQPNIRMSVGGRSAPASGIINLRKPSSAIYMNTTEVQIFVNIEPIQAQTESTP